MNKPFNVFYSLLFLLATTVFIRAQINPDTAQVVSIDRFSADAGHLFLRDEENGLPGPNEAIDFDQGPFITKGLGPEGDTRERRCP